MMKKKYLWIFAVLMVLMGVWTVQQARAEREYRINNVTEAVYKNHTMYGIDLKDNQYNIFRAQENGEAVLVRVPAVQGDEVWEFSNLITDSVGRCYIYGASQKNGETAEIVYEVIFEENVIEERWNISGQMEGDFWFLYNTEENPAAVSITREEMLWYALNADGSVMLQDRYELPNVSLILVLDDGGRIWFYDMYGNIYVYDENHRLQMLFANDGTQVSVDNIQIRTDEDVFQFYNITDGCWYEIKGSDIGGTIRRAADVELVEPKGFDRKRMDVPEYVEEEDLYAGVLPLEDGRQVPVVYGSREQIYDPLILDRGAVLRTYIPVFLLREAALAFFLTAFWLIFLRRTRFPLWERVLFVMVPVIALGYTAIAGQIDRQMEQVDQERHLDLLLGFGETRLQSLNLDEFLERRAKDCMEPGDETGMYLANITGTSGQFLTSLYFVKDGEIFNADGLYQYNVSMRHTVFSRFYEAMKTAIDTGKPSWLEYNDLMGRWYSVFLPIWDDSGEIAGLMQVQSQIEWEVAEGAADAARVRRSVLFLSAGIAAVVFILLRINMRFLNKLLRAVEKAADGDRSVRVRVSGFSEAAVAGRAFNEMLADLDENLRGLEAFNQKYQAFVPREIFRLMGRKGPDRMHLGEEEEIVASVLSVGHDRLASVYLEKFLAVIRERCGAAGSVSETQMDNIFPGNPVDALDAAVFILQKERDRQLHMGLDRGPLCLGVIGAAERLEVKMISDSLRFACFLREEACRSGASLLVSGSFLSQTETAGDTYHKRLLGYIYMDGRNVLEPVWEILDGEPQEVLLIKEETRESFERGVRLFMVGEFARARREFIQVLEQNGSDRAASRYSFLCDKYQEGTCTESEIYLEKFI